MTPFASVAMLEKLALLKIAFCRAPALSSTSSACLREVTSPAPSETPIRLLVTSFPLAMVLPPVTCTAPLNFAACFSLVTIHTDRHSPDRYPILLSSGWARIEPQLHGMAYLCGDESVLQPQERSGR